MPSNISYTIEHSPSYAQLKLKIPANKTVLVEASGMAAMDSHITANLLHPNVLEHFTFPLDFPAIFNIITSREIA
jgi:hypothetical protein